LSLEETRTNILLCCSCGYSEGAPTIIKGVTAPVTEVAIQKAVTPVVTAIASSVAAKNGATAIANNAGVLGGRAADLVVKSFGAVLGGPGVEVATMVSSKYGISQAAGQATQDLVGKVLSHKVSADLMTQLYAGTNSVKSVATTTASAVAVSAMLILTVPINVMVNSLTDTTTELLRAAYYFFDILKEHELQQVTNDSIADVNTATVLW